MCCRQVPRKNEDYKKTLVKFLKRMFLSIIFLQLIFLLAPVNYVDKELKPYYDQYMTFVNGYCDKDDYFYPNKVSIKIADIRQQDPDSILQTIGYCESDSTSLMKSFNIVIDRSSFNNMTKLERFQLVAHEMRHCLFLADHSLDPSNYMYPEMQSISEYQLYSQIVDDISRSCMTKE